MDSITQRYYGYWWKRNRPLTIVFSTLLIFMLTVTIWWIIDVKQYDELALNVFATLLGVLLGIWIVKIASRFMSRHEDEQKVCYKDKTISKQYGDNYLQRFLINGHPASVYADTLFIMSEEKDIEVTDDPDLKNIFEPDTIVKANCLDILFAHGHNVKSKGLTVRLKEKM